MSAQNRLIGARRMKPCVNRATAARKAPLEMSHERDNVSHVVAAEQAYLYTRASRVRFAELSTDVLLATAAASTRPAGERSRAAARRGFRRAGLARARQGEELICDCPQGLRHVAGRQGDLLAGSIVEPVGVPRDEAEGLFRNVGAWVRESQGNS